MRLIKLDVLCQNARSFLRYAHRSADRPRSTACAGVGR
jgi:hypothetical protein